MPLVRGRRIPLSFEYMSQMASAVRAHNLRPLHAKCAICVSCDCARNVVKVRRPAAARLEFVVGFVKRRVAAGAGIDAVCGHVLVVLAAEGGFGAFFTEDSELFCIMSEAAVGTWHRTAGDLPLFKTACHSWSDLLSLYVILAEAGVEPKREPKNGMDGIDRSANGLLSGPSARYGCCVLKVAVAFAMV